MYNAKHYSEAIEHARRGLEIDANVYIIWHGMGFAQLQAGLTQEAIASFKRGVELAPWDDAMFEALDAAYSQRNPMLLSLHNEPFFGPYRADPRFQTLLARK